MPAARRVSNPNGLGTHESEAAWQIDETGIGWYIVSNRPGTVSGPQRIRETGQTDAPGDKQC